MPGQARPYCFQPSFPICQSCLFCNSLSCLFRCFIASGSLIEAICSFIRYISCFVCFIACRSSCSFIMTSRIFLCHSLFCQTGICLLPPPTPPIIAAAWVACQLKYPGQLAGAGPSRAFAAYPPGPLRGLIYFVWPGAVFHDPLTGPLRPLPPQ